MVQEVYVIGSTSDAEVTNSPTDIPELINCTACNKSLKIRKRKVCKHPRLNVLLCKSCLKFISSNEFTKDEMGLEEYCTWCGDGGNLVCCDFCEKAYCKHCVKRNLGKEFLKTLLNADSDVKWKCFCCDTSQVITFIDECKAIMKHVESLALNEETSEPKKVKLPPKTVPMQPVKTGSTQSVKTGSTQSVKTGPTQPVKIGSTQPVKIGSTQSVKIGSTQSVRTGYTQSVKTGPSQSERRKRLTEVAKQVENVTLQPVGFKSSFPRYEISDDDDGDNILENNKSDEIDIKPNIVRLTSSLSMFKSTVGNPIEIDGDNLPSDMKQKQSSLSAIENSVSKDDSNAMSVVPATEKTQISVASDTVVPATEKTQISVASDKITHSQNDDDDDNGGGDISLSSGRRAKKSLNYNEKKLQKDAEVVAQNLTEKERNDEEKESEGKKRKVDSTETTKSSEKRKKSHDSEDKSSKVSKKKKRTIVMISSSEGSEEEIVVMSKSGKRRVISKSILMLAQAALAKGDSKKFKSKDDKSHKKEKKYNTSKTKTKNKISESSSSESDSSESDNEPLSQVKSKNLNKKQPGQSQKGSVNEDKDNGIDEQQPGPSGVRPKNKLQCRKQERRRQSMSSESSDDDNTSQKSGILSKKFRNKEENAGSKAFTEGMGIHDAKQRVRNTTIHDKEDGPETLISNDKNDDMLVDKSTSVSRKDSKEVVEVCEIREKFPKKADNGETSESNICESSDAIKEGQTDAITDSNIGLVVAETNELNIIPKKNDLVVMATNQDESEIIKCADKTGRRNKELDESEKSDMNLNVDLVVSKCIETMLDNITGKQPSDIEQGKSDIQVRLSDKNDEKSKADNEINGDSECVREIHLNSVGNEPQILQDTEIILEEEEKGPVEDVVASGVTDHDISDLDVRLSDKTETTKVDIEINSDSDCVTEISSKSAEDERCNIQDTETIQNVSDKELEKRRTFDSNQEKSDGRLSSKYDGKLCPTNIEIVSDTDSDTEVPLSKHDESSKSNEVCKEVQCIDSENENNIERRNKLVVKSTSGDSGGSDEAKTSDKKRRHDTEEIKSTGNEEEIETNDDAKDSGNETLIKSNKSKEKKGRTKVTKSTKTDSECSDDAKDSDNETLVKTNKSKEKKGTTKVTKSTKTDSECSDDSKDSDNESLVKTKKSEENKGATKVAKSTKTDSECSDDSKDSDNESLVKSKKSKEKKGTTKVPKSTKTDSESSDDANDSENESLVKPKKSKGKKGTTKVKKSIKTDSESSDDANDSDNESLVKTKKSKEKKGTKVPKSTKTDSKSSDDAKDSENGSLIATKKSKVNVSKSDNGCSDKDSDDESPIENKKTKRKKTTEERSTDSENESPLERRKSKRQKNTVKTAKSHSDSESSDKEEKSDKRKKKLSKRKHKSSSENSNNADSESDIEVSRKKGTKTKLKKKKKRVRYNSDVDSGTSSSNDDDDNIRLKESTDSTSSDGSIIVTRKSKRIKKKDTKKSKRNKNRKSKKSKKKDSDESEEESEEESPTKSRKQLRRILKDDELDKETIKAREAEEQRRKRLLERTKAEREEHCFTVEVVDGDFVLEKNEAKEPLVAISAEINKHLKPHQRKGIQFIYDCLIETVASFKKGDPGGGCLLAHCMGLGKTLQVVSFVHTVMNNVNIKLEKILVVCPLNTVLNWEEEFEKWLPVDERIDVFVLSYCTGVKERVIMMNKWYKRGGVLITGYEMYRNLVNCTHVKSKKMKVDVKKFLADPGPDMVVCDEGHILKNDASAISKAMNNITTKRRVVLTGTPLQNNLVEYHCMVDFVKPKLLGTRKEFTNRFVNPIHNGQCSNSTSFDVRLMKQRCHVLYQLLAGCVQRQDYSVLSPFLPKKREYTIFVRLGEKQIKLYEHYLEEFVYRSSGEKVKGNSLFSDFQCLARIWSHPWALHIDRIKAIHRNRHKEEQMEDDEFLDDEEDATSESEDKPKPWTVDTSSDEEAESKRRQRRRKAVEGSSSDSSSENDDKPPPVTTTSTSRSTRTTRASKESQLDADKKEDIDASEPDEIVTVDASKEAERGSLRSGINFKDGGLNPEREKEETEYDTEWFDKFLTGEDEHDLELGGKLVLLHEILANAEAVGDKVLVFSQSLINLDLIESSLSGGKVEGDVLNWCHGVDYFRMDGSTPVQRRKRWSEIFNDPENEQCRLFLISTKAGSLGINMVAANRVIVFDCSWNPSHDVQSVFRVYRFGQEKPVYVYRFIAQGTMEEKIYGRQITKLAVAGRVVDEMQVGRHFTDEEIRELYTFCPDKIEEGAETPQLPKDPLLAEVLQRLHPKFIVRYHEHDLLLENVEAEELNEDERKLAWKNYEEDKESATRRLDFANARNLTPDITNYTGQFAQVQQFANANLQQMQQQQQINRFRLANQVPGLQNQRYTITYPAEMSMEQRQQALLELRQRELMRIIQRNQQQILPRNVGSVGGQLRATVLPNNHNLSVNNGTAGNGYRVIRLPNMTHHPPGTSIHNTNFRVTPGTNMSSANYNMNNSNNTYNASSIIRNVQVQKNSESHQGGYLSQKKGRPSHYDT